MAIILKSTFSHGAKAEESIFQNLFRFDNAGPKT